jgi:hypothetical protein
MRKEAWHGMTVAIREENGYNDSDWIATYWDGEKFVEDLCGTTRFAFPISACIDAPENIMKLWTAERKRRADEHHRRVLEQIANDPTPGKRVEIVGGKKYKGKIGVIYWRGFNKFKTYYKNGYNQPENNQILAVSTDLGEQFFVPMEYARVIQEK